MVDYKEIPELIRAFLTASDPSGKRGWNDETIELANSYIALVKEANDRLRRCAEYLRRGMRSEAVHLAQCQPKLIELAEALRLPDPVSWTRACISHGLPPPPELLTDGLDQIQAAFGTERSLEPLLARHRLLALAQSPVKNRQEVLRAIAGADPENPAWDEGLVQLDVARFREMRLEAKNAFKSRNRAGLERLMWELENLARAPVPDDLRDGLKKAINALRLEDARKELLPLLTELDAAREQGNFQLANELLGKWQSAVDSAKVVLPADLQDRIRPTIVWLASETHRRGVEKKLETIKPMIQTSQQDLQKQKLQKAGVIAAIAATVGMVLWMILRSLRH